MKRIEHWIDGQYTPGTGDRGSAVRNPATGKQTGQVVFAAKEELAEAVATAVAAAQAWGASPLNVRSAVLYRFRSLLQDNVDLLAGLVTAEQGKVLPDARAEITRGIESVEFAAAIPHLLKGSYSQEVADSIDVHSTRQALGVVAGITPFNFPVMVPLWMCANAIACGNAFILKPSERDPSAALELARLWAEAGLPPGVFSVVQGDKEAVDFLLDSPEVSAVSFVGSTPVAREIYRRGTDSGKRVQALGGAKNHMLVLPDADMDLAADAAVAAAYGAAGERCMAISVLLAVGDAAEPIIEAIAKRIPQVVLGDGTVSGVDMGPVISAEHRDRVMGYITAGETQGARIVVDGREVADSEGFFVGPTLIDDVRPQMSIYQDEIFGPVLGVVRCATYEEALGLINGHEMGNGTAIFTRDGAAARRFQVEVKVGMVGVNVPVPVPVAYYSFGGWKASLFGDAHMYGPEGVSFFTRGKVVTTRWPESPLMVG